MSHTLKSLLAIGTLGLAALTSYTQATTVQFQTVMGDFEVNLFDNITPETVANFLEYVEAGDYTNTFVHRSVPGFIVQGGGFFYDIDEEQAFAIASNDPVINEPLLSNQRGTIAMAKVGNNPNSATNQWFISLANNSANLDNQNGGFTVFGQVTGNGMAIVDAIAGLTRVNFSTINGAFNVLPLRDYTGEDAAEGVIYTHENLVMVQNIVVLDASPDTVADLNPAPTTRNDNGGGNDGDNGGGSSGGGSVGWVLLMLLSLGLLRARCKV
ncbi:MAG TPA: peptidylprolyl isomerase [Cellvibrionaceae bacterium]